MIFKTQLAVFFFVISGFVKSQNTFSVSVQDSSTAEKLAGVTVQIKNTNVAAFTDGRGFAILTGIPEGEKVFIISFVGYRTLIKTITFPQKDTSVTVIRLAPENEDFEEVVVSTTRTNSRIDDLPIKVEVLGEEDMDEESTIVPGGVGSILGDLSVITIQKTNPVNGNDAVRMQGLDYKYTQMLRDGLPLYEGFSGSLGVLSLPPLDLKQVEIIKGSASTLYGGGAIGGLINFISRTPTDSPKVILTFNQTTLNESNFNSFLSKRNKNTGITLFSGANFKQAYDINKDGFAEVPEQKHFIFHPRFFMYLSKKTNADIGLTVTNDNRRGGDMYAIRYKDDSAHTFLFNEQVLRTTLDAHLTHEVSKHGTLTLKTTGSSFDRSLYYSGFNFSGRQLSSYSEINYLFKNEKHSWVTGANFIVEDFLKKEGDTVHFNNYNYQTLGLFSQEDWQIFKSLSLEAGFRADYHNRYNWFLLPRVGLFYKPSSKFSIRAHYGSGYKIPGLFTSSQPGDYARLVSVDNRVKPELSNGLNLDINYHTLLWEQVAFQLNQAFYYTVIFNPTILQTDSAGNKFITNAPYTVNSIGTDTYIRFKWEKIALYLGYNHTEATLQGTTISYNMPFNPKDKFATTLAYEIEGKWRMGAEAAYSANQYIYNNVRVPNFWFLAAMIERKFKSGSLVLNCENILNYRQSAYEPLVTGTRQNPSFRNIWGPVEGRVINLSLKITL
ncbi:MAG: TonB-dependent receptor [Bacteroidetes bacterium]|nr:TonB-dependent receptor [Bacteroidota bacterium]